MKNKFLVTLILPVCFAACQPKPAGTEQSANSPVEAGGIENVDSTATSKTCYTSYKNRDTVELSIVTAGNKVSGALRYQLYEKDRNKGTIVGEIKGDTLLANYTFNSEGMESQRQVAFLRKGDQLVEGYAEIEEKDGKVSFKDTKALKFGAGIELQKTDCKD
jgi:hypothetical protein